LLCNIHWKAKKDWFSNLYLCTACEKSFDMWKSFVFVMVCLLLADSAEYVECYTLDKGAGQASAKLYTMQLALADELVSIPVSSCFLHQIFLQGGLFGVLMSAFCWDVWSWRCCSRSPPLWLCLLLLFLITWTTQIRYGRSSNACYSGDGRYVTLWSKTRESRKAVNCNCNPLRINTTPLQSFLQTVVEISLQSHRYTYVASFFVTFFLDLIF
jgi:hypothetical protein